VLFLGSELIEQAAYGCQVLFPLLPNRTALADDELVEREGLRFGKAEGDVSERYEKIISEGDVHEVQFLGGHPEVFEMENALIGFGPRFGQEFKFEIFVDELHESRMMEVYFKAVLLHHGRDVGRWFVPHPFGHEQIRVGGGGGRDLERIAEKAAVEVLAPASDEDAVREYAGLVE
jgi:hypothetical protein